MFLHLFSILFYLQVIQVQEILRYFKIFKEKKINAVATHDCNFWKKKNMVIARKMVCIQTFSILLSYCIMVLYNILLFRRIYQIKWFEILFIFLVVNPGNNRVMYMMSSNVYNVQMSLKFVLTAPASFILYCTQIQ